MLRLLLLLALLSACSDAPRLQPLQRGDIVLAFGDSLTLGSGVAPEHSYPAVLQQMSALTVVNAGVAGEDTDSGLQRLPELLRQYRPKLVILTHGGNDLLRQRDSKHIQANLSAMVELIRAAGSQVVLVAVPRPGLWPQSADFYAALADSHRLPLEPDIVAELESDSDFKSDRVHFNQRGYRRLAQALYQLLQNSGALPQTTDY
jgi:lysophospholipase L1-like esterase